MLAILRLLGRLSLTCLGRGGDAAARCVSFGAYNHRFLISTICHFAPSNTQLD
jgi:hypothetical protein